MGICALFRLQLKTFYLRNSSAFWGAGGIREIAMLGMEKRMQKGTA